MLGDQGVELGDPLESFRKLFGGELVAGVVHQMDVVMGLGPVIAHKDCHRVLPWLGFNR